MKILALTITAMLIQISTEIPPGASARIEGLVLGPNGPVAGAEVDALWDPIPISYRPDMVPRTKTSSDGRFLLWVPSGAYRVTARAAGFVSQTFGAARPGQDGAGTGLVLKVDSQESLKDLTIQLTREGIISGRVTTTTGQPLVRIEVAALKKKFTATGVSLGLAGTAQTNDRGEYRMSGLGAGPYIIVAAGLNSLAIEYEAFVASRSNTAAPPVPSGGAFGPVYYPEADHWSRATSIDVQPGLETRNIDFLLPKGNVYSIRGRIIGLSNEKPSVPAISVRPANADYATALITSGNAYNPDGTFELTGIAPGFHWVTAQVSPRLTVEQRALLYTPGADLSELPRPSRGAALVHVTSSDIDNLELIMVRDLEVSGRLSVDEEQFDFSKNLADFALELRPTDPLGNGASSRFSPLTASGQFVYRNLLPTDYRFVIAALPPPFYVKEVRYGNTDGLTESLRLTRPLPDRLNIVLARGAEVTGTIIDRESRPLENLRVVLVPDELPNRSDLYKATVTNAAGQFKLQGVAPGIYKAYAWERLEDFQYFDEGFLSRYRETGTYIRVSGTASMEIRVNLNR